MKLKPLEFLTAGQTYHPRRQTGGGESEKVIDDPLTSVAYHLEATPGRTPNANQCRQTKAKPKGPQDICCQAQEPYHPGAGPRRGNAYHPPPDGEGNQKMNDPSPPGKPAYHPDAEKGETRSEGRDRSAMRSAGSEG